MGAVETDWVTLANSLLGRCHLPLPLADLTHCDACFFVALYEAILGEPVPDLIADSRTAEDDAHNVQCVIDSLALDYLQVSLSHITGENVVRRDPDSIKNLLEIFDGLLEYLTEQISEASSQTGDDVPPLGGRVVEMQGDGMNLPPSLGSLSSGAGGSESTAELIRLGDTARSFALRGDYGGSFLEVSCLETLRKEVARTPDGSVCCAAGSRNFDVDGRESARRATRQGPPAAILLKSPCQQDRPRAEDRDVEGPEGRGHPDAPTASNGDIICEMSEKSEQSPARREAAREAQKMASLHAPPYGHLMTLQSDRETTIQSGDERRPEERGGSAPISWTPDSLAPSDPRARHRLSDPPPLSDPRSLSDPRARHRLSELELQQMSETLSRRLDELDQMLKKALGVRSRERREEDKLSQHSDSIMETRRERRQQAPQQVKTPGARPRSLSPPRRSVSAQFQDALNKDGRGAMAAIRRGVQKELDLERVKSRRLRRAYEDELQNFQETEKQKLAEVKDALRAEEQEYDVSLRDPPRSRPERVYSGKLPRPKPWTPNLHKPAVPMTVAEDDLLPLLLEEFPNLQISPQALSTMWKRQLVQAEQLARAGQEDERSQRQLQREVQDAHRKQELLVGLIQREQEHNQRLKDFKDRIRLQKSAQNRVRETRQQVARAKRYYEDYHVQLRAKLLRARTREERMLRQLFAEGLELQKQRLRQVRDYAQEQREEQRRRHKDELESMENYYKDQFSMVAEAVSQERQQLQTREKAQAKNLHKMKRELRAKMEKELRALQERILRTDEDAFYRDLEAERLQRRLHMAAFQYSKSHGL